MSNHPSAEPGVRAFCCTHAVDLLFVALAAASLAPMLCVRYPLCVDYLNHMARLFILTAPDAHPIHHYYVVHWHLLANLGLEIVTVPLTAILSVEAAMKVAWGLCVVGMAASAWFLHRSLHDRSEPTILLAAPMLLSLPLTSGFLSYTLGTVLMLFTTGLWIRFGARPRWRHILLFNLLGALTVLFHVAAFGALGLTVVILHAFRAGGFSWRRTGTALAAFALPLVLIAVMMQTSPTTHNIRLTDISYTLSAKIGVFSAATYVANPPADFIGGIVVLLSVALVLRFAGGKCHPLLVAPLVAWAAILLLLPDKIGDAANIDRRSALVFFLLLVASVSQRVVCVRTNVLVAVAAAASVLLRLGFLLPAWLAHDGHVASFRALGARLPVGAKVLVAETTEEVANPPQCLMRQDWPPFEEHIPTLLTIDRAAFVSTIFADPKMQPIVPAKAVRGYAMPNTGIQRWAQLATEDRVERHLADAKALPRAYWEFLPTHWRARYDYLAVRQLTCDPPIPAPPWLIAVGRSDTYRLYRIVRP